MRALGPAGFCLVKLIGPGAVKLVHALMLKAFYRGGARG